jgi:hypothetical protein
VVGDECTLIDSGKLYRRCELVRLQANPALQHDPSRALLLPDFCRFILSDSTGAGAGKHFLAAASGRGQPGFGCLEFLVDVALGERRELERLTGEVGVEVGQRCLQADVGCGSLD